MKSIFALAKHRLGVMEVALGMTGMGVLVCGLGALARDERGWLLAVGLIQIGLGLLAALAARRSDAEAQGWVRSSAATHGLSLDREDLRSLAAALSREVEASAQRQAEAEAEKAALHATLAERESSAERQEADRLAIMEALGDALEQLAVGDLSVRLHDRFPHGYDQIRIDFNASMESLSRAMDSILEATEAVSFGAAELSRAAERLSSRTDQQAQSVRDSASSLKELHREVAHTTQNAEQVLGQVGRAKDSVAKAGDVMQGTMAAMARIETSSGEIGQISTVINEIAFQTNLLALNAGVEAARAGDAGRGFAVVAAEVRALSQRTGEAARQISTLVQQAGSDVAAGVGQVNETGRVLAEIVGNVGEVNQLVGGIAQSTRSQAESISAINEAVGLIDEITRNNAAMVAEATGASQTLAGEAKGLTASISRFKRSAVPGPEAEEDSPERQGALDEIDRLFG